MPYITTYRLLCEIETPQVVIVSWLSLSLNYREVVKWGSRRSPFCPEMGPNPIYHQILTKISRSRGLAKKISNLSLDISTTSTWALCNKFAFLKDLWSMVMFGELERNDTDFDQENNENVSRWVGVGGWVAGWLVTENFMNNVNWSLIIETCQWIRYE